MPFVNNLQDEDQQQNQQGQQQPAMVAPGTGAGPLSASSGASPQAQPKQGSSGRWTNLNSYLGANQQQAGQLGSTIVGRINDNIGQTEGALTSANNIFQSQVSQNTVQKDDNVLSQVRQDPTKVDVNAFSRMRDATYQGPQNLSEIGGFQQGFEKARQQSEAAQNESGRSALIQDMFNRPTYSRGENKLDQLLIQNNEQARSQFQTVQPRFQQLESMLGQKTDAAQQMAQQAKQQTEAARQAAQSTIQSERDSFNQMIESRVQQEQAKQLPEFERLRKALAKDQLSAADMAKLGLNAGTQLFNLDPTRYLVQGSPDAINANNVATKDDFARYQALAQLAGVDPTLLYNQDLAGTAGNFATRFDSTGFNQALAQAGQSAQADYTTPGRFTPSFDLGWTSGNFTNYRDGYATFSVPGVGAVDFKNLTPKVAEQILPALRNAESMGSLPNAVARERGGAGVQALIQTAQNVVNQYNQKHNATRKLRGI